LAKEEAKVQILNGRNVIKEETLHPDENSWQTSRLEINLGVGSYALRISTNAASQNFFIYDLNFCAQEGKLKIKKKITCSNFYFYVVQ